MTFEHSYGAVLRKELKGGLFYRAAIILSFLCLFGGASLLAQDATGLDAQTGILPFQSYHGGEIDKVNLSNGKLDVRIPLVSYGQRAGKMKIEYALVYTNTGLFIPGCLPTAFSSGACAIIFPFQSGFSGPIELGRVSGRLSCAQKVTQDVHGNQLFSYPCVAILSTPDGGAHQMVPISPTSFMAADGTGYRIDMLPGFDVTNPNHQAGVVTTPDGVRFPGAFFDTPSANPIVEEDSNGNMIVQNGSGLLDSLGRDIPAVGSSPVSLPGGVPSGLGNTDSSGCTGPLPIVTASLWIPPGVDGGAYPLKFCFVNVAEINPGGDQNFESCGPPPAGCEQFDVVLPPLPTVAGQLQSVVLPNGTAWTFEYATDGTGNLSKITFPTGGTISYTWIRMDLDGPAQITSLPPLTKIQPMGVATRVVDPNDGSSPAGTWQYNYIRGQAGPSGLGSPFVTTVTDPELNDTVHTYAQFDLQSNIYETLTQYFQGSATSGQLLKSIKTDYKSFTVQSPSLPALGGIYQTILPFGWTTTLDNGLQRREEQDWDIGFLASSAIYLQHLNNNVQVTPCGNGNGCSGGAPYGQIVATREFDYGKNGPGGLLRSTSVSHLAFINSAYLNNNLLSLVGSKSMTDGAGNIVSSATDHYDETALLPSGISTGHDSNPPAGTARGNLTSETENIQEPANSCNNNITASSQPNARFSYYDTGMVAQSLDALQQPTNITYSADFKGAFPTKVCNVLNHCVVTSYDLNTGQKTSITDQNGQTMAFQYDNMGRAQTITMPAQVVNGAAIQGSTTFTYNDTPNAASVIQIEQMDAATSVTQTTFFDGLGRKSGGRISDPEGDVFTKTVFDPLGRVSTATNPYRTTSDPTFGITRNDYDALGRIVKVTHPDGNTTLTSFIGRAVQLQDQGNGSTRVTRISQSDALNHMVSLCEITHAAQVNQATPAACGLDVSGTGFLTSYRYDVLGNLIGVQQGGISRSFAYDSGSRLLNASNPESGTTCYHYDANNNLLSRTRPTPNQSDPTVTVTTNYQYDALNRQTSVKYSDSVTPSISKHYDTTSELRVDLSNTIGRLSAVYATSPSGQLISGAVYSYDPEGRIIDNSQCTPQNCSRNTAFPLEYSYDLMGHALSATNGEGVTFNYSYNSGNRLTGMTSTLSDATHPASLLQNIAYNPFGNFSSLSLGNAVSETITYDNLGRIVTYSSAPPVQNAMLPAGQGQVESAFARLNPQSLAGPFHRSAAASDGIVIASDSRRKKSDRAMIVVRFNTLDSAHLSTSVQAPYHGQGVLRAARTLAKNMNHNPLLQVRAKVERRGASALVTVRDRVTGKRASYTLSVAVVGMAMPPIHAEPVALPRLDVKASAGLTNNAVPKGN